MAAKKTYPQTQYLFLTIQAAGDFLFGFLGLSLAFFLRFHTPLSDVGYIGAIPSFESYFRLILVGALFLSATFAYLNLYDGRLLLRDRQCIAIMLKGVIFWVFVFLGTSLALKFEPAVSRLFVIASCFVTFLTLSVWRIAFSLHIHRSRFRQQLEQRVAIVGWNREVAEMCDTITNDRAHPYQVEGIILPDPEATNVDCKSLHLTYPVLGCLRDFEAVLEKKKIDILILSETHLPKEEVIKIAEVCEQHYVDFKVIPSYFQIFISGLKLQTISGLPILGVETLAINQLVNQNLKRLVDVVGALVGLLIALPIIAVLAILIKKQSPGPIFFRQERIGFNHRPFHMLKLRSMHVGADQDDHLNQSTLREDPRVFSTGSFMRRWNLDELPQFWNVLKGEMSLVGPRPERTFHVQQLGKSISHYNPRHSVKPGITGWAQVNGLRGDTSLEERVRHDLYYIENWSLWLDIQILFLTFIKRENAY
jgi:exopolysaccharide biosynthesis polyprenyl glycosylphosphotransferase